MRLLLTICCALALCAGCSSPQTKKTASSQDRKPERKSGQRLGAPTVAGEPANQEKPGPRITPLQEVSGKVARVNPQLRFVVVDFFLSEMPESDRRMSVYRKGQKVGEVKISGPARNNIVAADIIAGDAQVGDEIRSN